MLWRIKYMAVLDVHDQRAQKLQTGNDRIAFVVADLEVLEADIGLNAFVLVADGGWELTTGTLLRASWKCTAPKLREAFTTHGSFKYQSAS